MACTASWHSSIARQTTLNEPSRFVPYPLRRRDQSGVFVLIRSFQPATYCICGPHCVSYVAHASHGRRTSYLKPSCLAYRSSTRWHAAMYAPTLGVGVYIGMRQKSLCMRAT